MLRPAFLIDEVHLIDQSNQLIEGDVELCKETPEVPLEFRLV